MDFARLFLAAQGGLTLTGSYEQDKLDYPGWWENDVPIALFEIALAKRTVENTWKTDHGDDPRPIRGGDQA